MLNHALKTEQAITEINHNLKSLIGNVNDVSIVMKIKKNNIDRLVNEACKKHRLKIKNIKKIGQW
ncbi:Uncharacterised protein [Sphingobacterium spiritivorum]|uniref:Uncharacterized protein n=1 Tax=Sphingobacterium spiritivorum TaxID=258 RepID=A0A380CEI8_SPHSI|nr:Uncharacterised protein [Sphingobacterium spiritivorum]